MITQSMKRPLSRHKKKEKKIDYSKTEKIKYQEEKKRIQSPACLVPLDHSNRTIPSSGIENPIGPTLRKEVESLSQLE